METYTGRHTNSLKLQYSAVTEVGCGPLLTGYKPLWRDLQSIDVTSRWREDWQSATMVNSTSVVDPTIRLPGFDLHRRQWSLLNESFSDRPGLL